MLAAISTEVRAVTGSAALHWAAAMAASRSSLLPINATLSGSPGMPVAARVTVGAVQSGMPPGEPPPAGRQQQVGDHQPEHQDEDRQRHEPVDHVSPQKLTFGNHGLKGEGGRGKDVSAGIDIWQSQLGIDEEGSRGLSQFSSDENGTVPLPWVPPLLPLLYPRQPGRPGPASSRPAVRGTMPPCG